MRTKNGLFLALALFAVFLVYLPHFHNAFHFDDIHTIVLNPHIREIRNVPRFFTDATLFSVLPSNRVYRPVVSASLALDYWMGDGLKTFYFHASTFLWFLVQLLLMYFLFRKLADMAHPDSRNWIAALLATLIYGIHPAMAETVNYVIQRADLYSTLGVVAGVLLYAGFPKQRKLGLYLLPVVLGVLSKPTALVFPLILFSYIFLFEESFRAAVKSCIPSLLATGALGWLVTKMNPPTFETGTVSAYAYRITQPLVALRYFCTFFAPSGLTADTDHIPVTGIWDDFAWVGFLFLTAIVLAAIASGKVREWRPVSFGLWWFLLALLPTAIFPLSEVENDHRMFFPFVGLVLSATWVIALLLYRTQFRKPLKIALAALCALELVILAAGTIQRNVVWRTSESLWRDVTEKSPRNGRGLMNYGLALIEKGDYQKAIVYLDKAKGASRNYALVEYNLGVAYGKLNQKAEAEKHFLQALKINPNDLAGRFLYARWLEENGRPDEAEVQAILSIEHNKDFIDPEYLLLRIYSKAFDWQKVRNLSASLLARFPSDSDATAYQLMALWNLQGPATSASSQWLFTPDNFLNVSALHYLAGNYEGSIAAAMEVLRLRPGAADAYNNIAAAERARGRWKEAEDAVNQALRFQPGLQKAKENLARIRARKKDSNAQ